MAYLIHQQPDTASTSSSILESSPVPTNPIAALALPPLTRHWASLPPCAGGKLPQRPATGQQIKSSVGTSGNFEVLIKNGTERDAIVRLAIARPAQTVRFMYVRARENYLIGRVEPGTYDLSYVLGKDWIQGCNSFWQDSGVSQFEEHLHFMSPTGGEKTVGRYEATLNPVLDGNARTKPIDRRQFFEGN